MMMAREMPKRRRLRSEKEKMNDETTICFLLLAQPQVVA